MTEPPAIADERSTGRSRHLTWLLLAASVPALALVLDVRSGVGVGVRGVESLKLPELCSMRRFLGVPCPACGLTRSVILLMHGDLRGSLAMHRLGWLVFGLIVLQIPYRLLAMSGREPRWVANRTFQNAAWGALFVLLLLNRAFDLLGWK